MRVPGVVGRERQARAHDAPRARSRQAAQAARWRRRRRRGAASRRHVLAGLLTAAAPLAGGGLARMRRRDGCGWLGRQRPVAWLCCLPLLHRHAQHNRHAQAAWDKYLSVDIDAVFDETPKDRAKTRTGTLCMNLRKRRKAYELMRVAQCLAS